MLGGNGCWAKDHKNMTLIASDYRPIRSTAARLAGRRPFGRWMLSLPLYSLTLGHRSPKSFFAVAPDPWPGDPALGQRLVVGEFAAFGVVGAVSPASDDPPWQRPGANPLWLDALNSFGWLRDLRDCGDASSAAVAVRLVDDWADRQWRWSPGSAISTGWPPPPMPNSPAASCSRWPVSASICGARPAPASPARRRWRC